MIIGHDDTEVSLEDYDGVLTISCRSAAHAERLASKIVNAIKEESDEEVEEAI